MTLLEISKTYIEYHLAMTRRVRDPIDRIKGEQFLTDDVCSRGSIRNFVVHPATVDHLWLPGLKNQQGVGHLRFEDYPIRASARQIFESVAKDLTEFFNAVK